LVDEQRRLGALNAGGDPRTAVRAVFSWSYLHLPAEAARAFRLLGLHPGPDLDPYATAALTDTGLEQAQHVLDLLGRAHLVQSTGPGRYGMHDLLRGYATSLAGIEDSEDERRAALTRLFDYYLATASAAMHTLYPAEAHHRPLIPPRTTPIPGVTDPAAARAWLDTERATLTATCAHTAAHGWPGHTTRLAATMYRYLEVGGHYPDALTIHTHARHAARYTGDSASEAHALTNLGVVSWQQGRYKQATDHLQQALALFSEINDRTGEVRALTNLGLLSWQQGHFQQAAEHLQQALTLAREIGHQAGETRALTSLGLVYQHQGHYQQATKHQQQSLALCREIGDRAGYEAETLNSVGETHHATGYHEQAHVHHNAALTLASQTGDRYEQARAHHGIAHTHHATGDLDQARHHWRRALILYTDLGVPDADDVHAHLTALEGPSLDQAMGEAL
jgi:tetratricopeptide (TPR) repeat protein